MIGERGRLQAAGPTHRWRSIGVFAAAALALTALAAPAGAHPASRLAASSSPVATNAATPETNFTIGSADSEPVTAVVAANGTAYLGYVAPNASGLASAYVCVLPLGARACSTTTLLPPLDSATGASDNPVSLLLGSGGSVDALVTTDNDANADDVTSIGGNADTIEYVLNAAGAITTAGKRVGSLDQQGDAIQDGSQILWVDNSKDGSNAVQLQETPAAGTFPHISAPTSINLTGTPAASEEFFYGIDTVALPNGDLLIAWDDGDNAYDVEVDPTHSFEVVGSSKFTNELVSNDEAEQSGGIVTGSSGTYLLLRSSTDGFAGALETVKYTSAGHFAAPVAVTNPSSDYGDFKFFEDGSGHLSVYLVMLSGVLDQFTSTNGGASWASLVYPSALPEVTDDISVALTPAGAGVVFEASGGTKADGILPKVQPINVHQTITFTITPSSVGVGATATGSGTVTYGDPGQVVDLQLLESGKWVTVATTPETAGGAFSFPIKATTAGTFDYWVQTTPVTGWYYGGDDSPSRTLTVATVPGAPVITSAVGGNATATLTWTAPGSNGGSPITGYVITPYVGATAKPAINLVGTGLTHEVTALANGTLYSFKVAAKNAIGTGPQSAAAYVLPPFASLTAFVQRQFSDFLGRAATASEVVAWVGKLETGTTPAAFIEDLRTSTDGVDNVDPTTRLYFAYFLRIPDVGGLTYWIGQKRGGKSLYDISDFFAQSSEFKSTYGSLSNAAFVNLVYENVLGRAADPSGGAYWTNELNTGAKTRGEVMVGFSESSEYKTLKQASVDVAVTWIDMLGVAPDQSSFNTWVGDITAKTKTIDDLIDTILAEAAYVTRVT